MFNRDYVDKRIYKDESLRMMLVKYSVDIGNKLPKIGVFRPDRMTEVIDMEKKYSFRLIYK
jgi:hypothetical protein